MELALGIAGFLLVWTTTVVGGLIWLTRQFSIFKDELSKRLPYLDYERRHDILVNRVTEIELCMRTVKAKLDMR